MYETMPDFIASETTVAGEDEPGERLRISGRMLDAEGRPAEGVILYLYHTNSEGVYAPAEGQTGCARRHGRLRGWVKSDAQGNYAFNTILPGSYPNTRQEKHIHPVIKEPGKNEYYIDAFVFDNDPFLTEAMRRNFENRGGSGIISISKNASGAWEGTRDIVLGENVPGY
jgi:protocatechuate 3,4-dioxygenase beta subunit